MATTVDYILKVTADQANRALSTVEKNASELDTQFQKTSKRIGKSFLAIGAAVAGAGAAVVTFGQKIADLANQMSDASTKTGLATSTLQGLKLAAEGSGLSFASLESGLIRFQSSVTDAMSGTGAAADAFQALGIDLLNSKGELKDADTLFRQTTNALGQMESATLRNSMAIDLFGRQAGPALAQSGALSNMKEFAEFASEFGVNMKDAGEEAARFQRAMAEIKLVLEGVFEGFLTTATGTTKLSDALFVVADNIVYFGSIGTDILGNIGSFVRALIEGFQGISTGIKNTGKAFLAFLSGDFEKARIIADGTAVFIGQRFEAAFEQATSGLTDTGKMVRDAEAAVAKQQKLREQLLAATGGGGGGAGGGAGGGTGAARVEQKFGEAISLPFKELSDSLDELDSSIIGLESAFKTLPETLEKAFRIATAGMVADIALQSASGPGGTIRAIGDAFESLTMGMSGIIADSIAGIARLGEKSPKEIQQEFDNFVSAFSKGLEMLPRILIQVLPRFIVQLTVGILKGILKLPFLIADAIGELFVRAWNAIKEFFKSIFTKEGRQERREERRARKRRGEKGAIGQFFEELSDTSAFYMSGGIYRAQSGIRFTGAKRGLAMLHEGESVIPASGRTGQAEQRSFNQAGGNGVNIVINSAVVENRAIDELVRKLETRFGTFGVGKSTLFGR